MKNLKNKVDWEALKKSKEAKEKISADDIVFKDLCPATDEICKRGCHKSQCKKL
ncbi:hypothetical protein [Salinimicrobium sp. GXAS 041]|uniref:hypothetical protein n=1 Tax=Salinimicrobium sp. GXAS 041 TaxID=3400806 RepID=UPI003C71A179